MSAALPTITNAIECSHEYEIVAKNILETVSKAESACDAFKKAHSQFQYSTVDNNCITPIRAVVQTLAKIDKTISALNEANLNILKNDALIFDLSRSGSNVDKCEANILKYRNSEIRKNMNGALRKLSSLLSQYQRIMNAIGIDELTERDFERDEARYHIMTAMKQALIAARSRGGVIDEGNLIYLFDIGINGAQAQLEVTEYLAVELDLLKNGKAPTHEMTIRWLEACADKWIDCPRQWAARRGMTLLDERSLLPSHKEKDKYDE